MPMAVLLTAISSPASAVDAPTYDAIADRVELARVRLAKDYRRARDRRVKAQVLDEARQTVLDALTKELVPAWLGQPWAFSGRARRPGEGPIACGTFVGTLLRDAGFRLNRIAMGRLASEHIALSLTRNANLRRYSDRPVEEVEADVAAWGPELYMVGLDFHAGLLVVDDAGRVPFIHSTVYPEVPGPLSG